MLSLPPGPGLIGDANDDSVVDIFDINSISANWSSSGPIGDANGDGRVNIFDINSVSANWGLSGESLPVDEGRVTLWYDAATTHSLTRHGVARFEADSGQFLSALNPGLMAPSQRMTVSFWMHQSSLAADRAIVAQYDYPSDGSWAINTGGSGGTEDELRIWIADGTGAVVPYASTYAADLQADTWYHVTLVFDGTQTGNANRLQVYIDGESQTMAYVGSSLAPPNPSDVNHDGIVNIFDINLVSSNWGGTELGDANGDATVNIFDINLISAHWDLPSFDLNPNGSEIPSALRPSNAPLTVGKLSGTLDRYFDGSLDSLGIFTTAFTATEIGDLYNAGIGREYADLSTQQTSNLLAWWDLDELVDTSRMDATGHGWNLADTTHVAQRQIVSQWREADSGVSLNQSYATRPDYSGSAINGQGAVYFDGVNDVLRGAAFNSPNDPSGSIFYVVRFQDDIPLKAHTFFSSADESNSTGYLFFGTYPVDPEHGESRFRIRWRLGDLNNDFVGSTAIEPDTTYVVQVWCTAPGEPYHMRINGGDETLTGIFSAWAGSWYEQIPGRDNITVGAFERAGGDIEGFANVLIGEVVLLNQATTEAENRQVEQYLADKWGVSLPMSGLAATTSEAAGDGELASQSSIAAHGLRIGTSTADRNDIDLSNDWSSMRRGPTVESSLEIGSLVAVRAAVGPRATVHLPSAVDLAFAERDEPWTGGDGGRDWKFARASHFRPRLDRGHGLSSFQTLATHVAECPMDATAWIAY